MNDKKQTPSNSDVSALLGFDAPKFLTVEILKYIDSVRDDGSVNMFGCSPLIQDKFPELSSAECRRCLDYWMQTFELRHPE